MAYFNRRVVAPFTPDQWQDWFRGKDVQPKVLCDGKPGPELYDFDSSPVTNNNHNLRSLATEEFIDDSSDEEEVHLESIYSGMDDLSLNSMIIDSNKVDGRSNDVYKQYDFTRKLNSSLPISEHKKELLSAIQSHGVTIVHGSTGTGKTTQLPMYILQQHANRNKYCNIIVTQPRKLAAVSVARQVSSEHKWQVGQVVGYQVGLEKQTSVDTRITYVTTGVLLQILIKAKSLSAYTHVILDEVHERDKDSDLALLIVRKLLFLNSQHVRVVLMSATMDTTDFANYFSHVVDGSGKIELAPTVSINGRMFDVSQNFLDDLGAFKSPASPCYDHPSIEPNMYELAARLIWDLERRESVDGKEMDKGAVLVFLPGLYQIQEMENSLRNSQASKYFLIIPLHSTITLDEQRNVFSPPEKGFRKIILSTNIAESSLTVPDVKYVIDFCLTKCVVTDLLSNYQSLQLQWASISNCKQRAGRAGRVSDGVVFHLVTREFWNKCMQHHSQPELQRCSLESAILRVKQLNLGSPKQILRLAMSPPDLTNIARSIMLLREVGALAPSSKRLDGRLTFVGNVLAFLPLDMRLGKLLVLGYVFGCLKQCLVIAASLSRPSFMVSSYHNTTESYRKKLQWARGSFSDCLACLYVYSDYIERKERQEIKTNRDAMAWARQNSVHLRRLKEVESQVEDLRQRLVHVNIHTYSQDPVWPGENDEDALLILQVVIAAAFYPNYFEQNTVNEQVAFRELSTLNPNSTVVITGMPTDLGPLFKNSILHAVSDYGRCKTLYYDGSKVMIEFEDDPTVNTHDVMPGVYLACKDQNNVRKRIELYRTFTESKNPNVSLYDGGEAKSSFYKETINKSKYKRYTLEPDCGQVCFDVQVTHVDSPTKFWGTRKSEEVNQMLALVDLGIAQAVSRQKFVSSVMVNELVLAPFSDGHSSAYYRAMVLQNKPNIMVWFVDFGNVEGVKKVQTIMPLPAELKNLPLLAVKFELCGVTCGLNNAENRAHLIKLLDQHKYQARAKVYSVVGDCARVELFVDEEETSVNQQLIESGRCDAMEESLYSKQEHRAWDLAENDEETFMQMKCWWKPVDASVRGVPCRPTSDENCRPKGPYSPIITNFSSLLYIGQQMRVKVSHASLNAVSMCAEGSRGKLMMVAADVLVSSSGCSMMCRDTSLMPPVPGLASMMCLLFAPVANLRHSKATDDYTGMLCGLGATVNGQGGTDAVLPEHDIEIAFDRLMTREDVEMANAVRATVNMAIGSSRKMSEWGGQAMRQLQVKARKKTLEFIYKPRPRVDQYLCRRPYVWTTVNRDSLRGDYYPLHQL